MENKKVTISKGNSKMGEIPSVSLPPIVTCAENCMCAKKCYAFRLYRMRPNVKNSYDNNLEILNNDSNDYWSQVDNAIYTSRFFRFHVSGDIPNYQYFIDMVKVAYNNLHCEILVFTKQYELVNKALDNGVIIPKNLHVVFSEWTGMPMDNRYNLPVAHVIFKGAYPEANWKICSGNCLECARNKANCWTLQNGEHVAFHEH